MGSEWRLLQDGITEPYMHFAVEEAVLRLVSEGLLPPTLRLRQVQRAVFVGVLQDTWREVDVNYCREHGIRIVRRLSGGGAVYHDLGSFCFSAFFPRAMFAQTDEALYPAFAAPIIQTCADYGVNAHFHGRNDVLVGERKIYGSAQIALFEAFAHSGTFLVNMDFDTLARALTPPTLKFQGKATGSVAARVTSLARELGRQVPVGGVMQRFAHHFGQMFGVQLVPGDLTDEERSLAQRLLVEKYATDAWNLGTRNEYRTVVSTKLRQGIITLAVDMSGGTIRRAQVQGDLLLPDHTALAQLETRWVNCTPDEARRELAVAHLPPDIREAIAAMLDRVAEEELRKTMPNHSNGGQ